MLSPINTIKHYVPRTNLSVASGAVQAQNLVTTIAKGAARAAVSDVEEGAVIKAIHVEFWLNGRGASSTTQFTAALYKLPGSQANPTVTNLLNLGAWDNKKNILWTSQGVLGEDMAQSIPVIREWVLIPKGKQRFGLGDQFQFALTPVGNAIQLCGMATYKEYE